MTTGTARKLVPLPLARVRVADRFWAPRMETNRVATLPAEYEQCRQTGRIDAWRLAWKPGEPNPPHIFWDSDVAKWIEAAAYSLATCPDPDLEKRVDDAVDLMAAAQAPDGYLNTHYIAVEPDKRWTNLRDCHELYCAGHLIEAAVAYYESTGKRMMLDVLCRYADHIAAVFGREAGQKRGYCGHEEIELALVKLYGATDEQRYLRLAEYFVNERGQQPHYFDVEARARGEDPAKYWARTHEYTQSHVPIREQREVVGHAVRACYYYAGVAAVAAETGARTLLPPLRRVWEHLTTRRMYLTGGIGPAPTNEGFTVDYDLPNETAYAETCAAIALVFWAQRMLHLDPDRRYADVIERALYNGILSGVALDGRRFFYANPLAACPGPDGSTPGNPAWLKASRQDWFDCACCPPNLARLLASLGGYVYTQGPAEARVNLYVESDGRFDLGGQEVVLSQETDYPWDGRVRFRVKTGAAIAFALALRIPAWTQKARLRVNGRPIAVAARLRKGYVSVRRVWRDGDVVELDLPMPVERIEAHPKVRQDCGRIALQRGPIVYCLEEADNGADLNDLALPRRTKLTARFEPRLLGGIVTITGAARRRVASGWVGELYRPAGSRTRACRLKAIPYCVWANRKQGEMLVWIREA